MTPQALLVVGSLLAVAVSLVGALPPLFGKLQLSRLDDFSAVGAGVMLGVALGLLLPDAMSTLGAWTLVAALVGALLFRGLHGASSIHATSGVNTSVSLAMTWVFLALHTLGDGIAFGAATRSATGGLVVLVAILAHSGPVAFALATLFVRGGWRGASTAVAVAALGACVGAGAMLEHLLSESRLSNLADLTSIALATGAGGFVVIGAGEFTRLWKTGNRRAIFALEAAAGALGIVALARGLGHG